MPDPEARRDRTRRAPRPLRRGTALLPSLFTVANLGMGWYAIQQTTLALQNLDPPLLLNSAAKAIGWAILLDGFDGRIARMTNSTSSFGREFDSLADVISFGVAPALLAYVWGFRFLQSTSRVVAHLNLLAQVVVFLFAVAGAARLARFNIATPDLKPSNPGRPEKKYFIGMPIPAGAGVIAAFVHFFASDGLYGTTNHYTAAAVGWMLLLLALAFFMVSTWRFYSFKDIDLRRRHPFVITLLIALLVAAIWNFSEIVLLLIALAYMLSAVFWRLAHYVRRFRQHRAARPV
jgi:CDP-diacylglycerol--serine O-phosphatidyltransferase